MRFRFKASTAALLWLGIALPSAFSQQTPQDSRPANLQSDQANPTDDHLAELTPTSLSRNNRNGRRVTLKAQQHYLTARAAALDHHPEIYARETAKALSLDPQAAEIYLLRATQEIAAADYSSALWDVDRAELLNPQIAYGQTVRASILNGMRLYEDAFLLLRSVQGPEAENWQTIYERSRAEVGMGNLHGSELWSQRTLAAAPQGFGEAHLVRAEALELASRWDEANTELSLYHQSPIGEGQPHTSRPGSSRHELPERTGGGN
jgi:tetratricopeptide (TPR) repeat protein